MKKIQEMQERRGVSNRSRIQAVAVLMVLLQLFGLFGPIGLSSRAWADSVTFAGGAGTQNDPWLIETPAQLNDIRNAPSKFYKLIADIDLNIAPYNQGTGWTAIGTSGTPFSGGVDGDGHTISNLKINRQDDTSNMRNGLFGATRNATIRNVGLANVNVYSGANFAGSLVGEGIDTTISQVYATGSVIAASHAGGLIGLASGNPSVSITDSYFIGRVKTQGHVVGGLVGDGNNVKLTRSYAAAAVTGILSNTSGGLIGVNGTGTISASYYDQDVASMNETEKGEPRTTSAMKNQLTYDGWNFTDSGVWIIDANKNDGYPYLNYQHFHQTSSTWTDITGKGIFSSPLGITIDSLGNFYVVNYQSFKINKLVSGTTEWLDITGGESFNNPTAVAVDSSGNVYVADRGNKKIKKLPSGDEEWTDITGTENMSPNGIAVDSFSNVYVTDGLNSKIKKLSSGTTTWMDITGSASFSEPYGIAVDSSRNVYVADFSDKKIKKLPSGATVWTNITVTGGFSRPSGIAADSFGNVYVSDSGNNKIKKLPSAATLWTDITGAESFSNPYGIATDSFGDVYVADLDHNKIKRLSLKPIANPPGGVVVSGTTVALTTGFSDATIFYTTDGSTPSSNDTVYSNPISVISAMTIKAIAVKPGMTDSEIASFTYTIKATTYTVTYNGNGAISGSAPTDDGSYVQGAVVAVNGNTGGLVKPGFTFSGWSMSEDGSGTNYAAGNSFDMGSSNVILYAKWTAISGNADLEALALSDGNLNPTFAAATTSYTASVANSVSSVAVTATVQDVTHATVTASVYNSAGNLENGPLALRSGVVSDSLPLSVGSNRIKIAVTAEDGTLKTYAVTVTRAADSAGGSGPGGSSGVTPGNSTSFRIIVDGKEQEQIATASSTKEDSRTVLTVTVDTDKLAAQLAKAGDKPVTIIPVTSSEDKVSVVLTGEAVKLLENKQVVLIIQTPNGNYKLPATEVLIDQITKQLGQQAKLSEIVVHVDIIKSDAAKVALMNKATNQGNFTVVVPPVDFTVTASYNGKTVGVDKFSSYVERELPLPDGADPGKVTTAVVLDAEGSIRHVPTYVIARDGKHYAVVNSLTNSTYSLLWHPMTFADVEKHWAKDAVNDMASRMVVNGVDATHYNPDAAITRAEFAAIIVRALGLADNGTTAAFKDVKSSAWYVGAVAKAQEYGLINGYQDETFRPMQTITREEAMAIIARAMKLTGLDASVGGVDAESVLAAFKDGMAVEAWAKQAVAAAVKSGLVKGSDAGLLPKSDITRAETAAIVQRMLEKSNLI